MFFGAFDDFVVQTFEIFPVGHLVLKCASDCSRSFLFSKFVVAVDASRVR